MQPCSLVVLLLLCVVVVLSHSHGKTHYHEGDEPPHYKYSPEANVKHDRVSKNLRRRSEPATRIWAEVSLAVLLISLAPLFVLCLLPNLQKHRSMLKLLLAFAAGGLLGDAFLHLVPHAIEATQNSVASAGHHDHKNEDGKTGTGENHREYSNVGLSVLFGVFTFLCVEKLIRLTRGSSGHHHLQATVPAERLTKSSGENSVNSPGSSGDTDGKKETSKKKKPKMVDQQAAAKGSGIAKDPVKMTSGSSRAQEMKVASYLNLTADFMHNFTDGLAIGTSFLMSRSLGIVTTFTVLMHELPHEIGDYAILVQSGCSSRKAILLQLTTAVGAALGAALSLLAAGVGLDSLSVSKAEGSPVRVGSGLLAQISSWFAEGLATAYLLAFTAGGFIYIAMTSVLPDLLEDEVGGKEVANRRRSIPGFWYRLLQTLGELLAVTAGVGLMISLGLMEEA